MQKIQKILKQVANQNNSSIDEVRKEIKLAMQAAMSDSDPKIQQKWRSIPKENEELTPEELIAYLVKEILELS